MLFNGHKVSAGDSLDIVTGKTPNWHDSGSYTNAKTEHRPLIFFDVEATGLMNGNDNHISQIALTAYNWNAQAKRYELQDNLFMLAKAHPDTLHEIDINSAPTKENAEKILKDEYVWAYKREVLTGITNCENRMETLEGRIEKTKEKIANCTPKQIKKKEGYENTLKSYEDAFAKEQKLLDKLNALASRFENVNGRDMSTAEIDVLVNSVKTDPTYIADRNKVITSKIWGGTVTMADADRTKFLEDVLDKAEVCYEEYKKTGKSDYYMAKDPVECYKENIARSRERLEEHTADLCNNIGQYINKRLDAKLAQMEQESLKNLLKMQGIDRDKWIKDGQGLTAGEMQVGIREFMSKYKKSDTVFITEGVYAAKHYLSKDEVQFLKPDDSLIDLFSVMKQKYGDELANKWGSNVAEFAAIYAKETGKEIKTFDAYTKSLCFAEMVARREEISFTNQSFNHLCNAVTEKVASMDADYVMSATRASTLNWHIATEYEFDHSDFHFNSLDYVDFGNQKKYVDLDKLFEVNNNFEVTLEGEKEPIKTWEELENKIKALNSNISEPLLERIKEKYEEISKEADEKWKADLETRYNEGRLSADRMNSNEREYLSTKYDLSGGSSNSSRAYERDEENERKRVSFIASDSEAYKDDYEDYEDEDYSKGGYSEYAVMTYTNGLFNGKVDTLTFTNKSEAMEYVEDHPSKAPDCLYVVRLDYEGGEKINSEIVFMEDVKSEPAKSEPENAFANKVESLLADFNKEMEIKQKTIEEEKALNKDITAKNLAEVKEKIAQIMPYLKAVDEKTGNWNYWQLYDSFTMSKDGYSFRSVNNGHYETPDLDEALSQRVYRGGGRHYYSGTEASEIYASYLLKNWDKVESSLIKQAQDKLSQALEWTEGEISNLKKRNERERGDE